MYRTQEEWIEAYRQKGALWIHDGNPRRPHALLTSGKHSNGFFNSRLVITDEALLRDAASDLLERFILRARLFVRRDRNVWEVQGVVGPQTGATKLAELMSKEVTRRTGRPCFWASPAKHESEGQKSMVFNAEDLGLLKDQSVLLCEDVLTTGGSVDLAASAIASARGIVRPFILVLVNRSGLTEAGDKRIIALIDRPMPTWAPEECPLCKEGSEAVRPKDNWARLNAVY